jgi:tetratricopeptide (TPR) repeat protein
LAEPDNADAHYLAGLCAYYLNNPSATYQHLQQALVLAPNHPFARHHPFARLYLGHQLFDNGRYRDAAEQFGQVDASEFDRLRQRWRALKLAELQLCCRLYENEIVSPEEVESLAQEYTRGPEDELALPAELVKCGASVDAGQDKRLQKIIRTVRSLVDAIGMPDGPSGLQRRNSN